MGVRESIDRSRSFGEPLGESDSRVAQAETASTAPRAWFGTDSHDRPVAYFEIGDDRMQPFAVSQVIEVTPVEATIGSPPETVHAAKVVCHEPRLDDVFVAFMDDVLTQLGPQGSVDVLVRSAAEWRNLLRVANQGMSAAAATGLYGELRFLEELVTQHGPQTVATWQRDGNDVHDFIGEAVRVEVKTSPFQNQHSVTIHGLKQLEPPAVGDLFLAVAEIEKHGAGETIDEVVDRLLDRGVPLGPFIDKLAIGGFVRGMGSGDGDLTFTLRSWRFWQIYANSPVLTASAVGEEVAESVSNVQYSMLLSALGESSESFDWDLFAQTTSEHTEG